MIYRNVRKGWSDAWIYLLGFSLCSFSLSAFASELRVAVVDLISGRPVAGANVSVQFRPTTIDEMGTKHLAPLTASEFLASSRSGDDGAAIFQLSLDAPIIAAIEISAGQYESQTETLLELLPASDFEETFYLVRQSLTAAEAEFVRAWHESVRAGDQVQQGPFVAPAAGELRAFAVTVPDEVRVENLNGFTGMMNLDEFIGGVVTREMNDGFPREALRAQAVASRSYALDRLRTRGYANGGQAYSSTVGSLSRAAAIFTSKQVLLYNGAIAQAFFSARCNGDFTLNSEDGPTLTRCFPGGLTTAVVPYCRSRPCSGHSNCSSTSEQCCTVTIDGKTNHIYGHGVGLCQRGAQQFASRDRLSYSTILSNYYTNVRLHTGTNSLELKIVLASAENDGAPVVLEIRSGQPDTMFDLQSATTLTSPLWSSAPAERGLTTGASAVTQLTPAGSLSSARYFRAVLR